MKSTVELDYLVVGHVTRDLVGNTFTIGGTASYAARTARALGCRVGVVTSADPALDLSRVMDDILVTRIPADTSTTFENIYTSGGRRQVLHGVAKTLGPQMVPTDWRAGVIHLGPVARECDPALINAFDESFIGLTPQGWMRCWDQAGNVSWRRWENAEALLARADAVVLSEEDVAGDKALVTHYAAQTPLLVLTQAVAGCTVYEDGRPRRVPVAPMHEVSSTGAGDIFAAAFFVWVQRTGDPWTAARLANCVAARSVTRDGLAGTPSPDEVDRCEQTLRKQAGQGQNANHLRASKSEGRRRQDDHRGEHGGLSGA